MLKDLEAKDVLFFVLVAMLTVTVGYRFGEGNQLEALPLIMRGLDPSFLKGDFFVDHGSGFGPRYYYATSMAWLGSVVSLPVLYWILSFSVNALLCGLTYLVVREMLNGDQLAGFLAVILLVFPDAVAPGGVSDVLFHRFQPGSLGILLGLCSLFAAWKRKPILTGLLASLATLPHPLYGLQTGLIAFATFFVVSLVSIPASETVEATKRKRDLLWGAAGLVFLLVWTFLFWIGPMRAQAGSRISSPEFIQILGYFRAPHHYIPSHFDLSSYVGFTAFVLTAGYFGYCWYRVEADRRRALALFVPPVLVLLGCVGGYLFVEVWPTRLWLTAQPFRLLYLVRWVGCLLLGWGLARWFRASSIGSWYACLALVGTSGDQGPILLLSTMGNRLNDFLQTRSSNGQRIVLWLGAGVLVVLCAWMSGMLVKGLGLAVALACVVCLRNIKNTTAAMLVPCVLVAMTAAIVSAHGDEDWAQDNAISSFYSLEDHQTDETEIARWARAHTDKGSVFLTPPRFGLFRIFAWRSIVIDFKSVPFGDADLVEWRERMAVCYGRVHGLGRDARAEMERNYASVSDVHLDEIKRRYGARYAVLWSSTSTQRTVVFQNQSYKIVQL